jgi:hypothetical protein
MNIKKPTKIQPKFSWIENSNHTKTYCNFLTTSHNTHYNILPYYTFVKQKLSKTTRKTTIISIFHYFTNVIIGIIDKRLTVKINIKR